jgi:hypothetical protein
MSVSGAPSSHHAHINATIVHDRPGHPAPSKGSLPSRRKVGRAEAPKIYGYFVSPMAIFNAAQRDGTTVNNKPFDTFMQWRSRLSVLMELPNNSRLFFPVDTAEVCGYYVVLATNFRGPVRYLPEELVEKLKVFMGNDEDPSWHRVNLHFVRALLF